MTIAPHPRGWKVTVDVRADERASTKRRRVSRICQGTKKDARTLEAELRLAGRTPVAATITVAELLEEWFRHVAPDLSPKTRQGYRQHIDHYLIPAFGPLQARKLTSARIDGLYGSIRKEGAAGRPLSPATVKRIHATLSSACRQAVLWGWLPMNPCENTSKGGRQLRRQVAPTALEDIESVIALGGDDLCEAVGLALATGARRGELCGIQWADIDLDNATVTIRRSIGDISGKAVIIEDRRKSPTRVVTIDATTVAMLRARRARHVELALAAGIALEPSGYVLAEEPGQREPLRPARMSQRWRDAAKKADVKVRLHDIRHWHVTTLLAAKYPQPNLIERAGWTSGAMLRTYGHAVAELDREAADIIGLRRERAK
jgi:integrase